MHLRLTTTERRTLRLALTLAMQWEESLADASEPIYGPSREQRRTIRTCARNVAAFARLAERVAKGGVT
jgi:hypothetical protein